MNERYSNVDVSREMSQLILRYVPAPPRVWGDVTPTVIHVCFCFDAKSFRAITKLKIGRRRWCPSVRNLLAFSRNARETPSRQNIATSTRALGKRRVETRISSPLAPYPPPSPGYYSTTSRRN